MRRRRPQRLLRTNRFTHTDSQNHRVWHSPFSPRIFHPTILYNLPPSSTFYLPHYSHPSLSPHPPQESMDSTANGPPYFIEEEDDTQPSLSDMEAGFSGSHPFFSRSCSAPHRRGSFRSLSCFSAPSPRSARFYDARFEDHMPHFLEACFLCNKPLGDNRDIFMYRGDTPFCSEECRQEQIEMDEAKEMNRSFSMKALRKEQKSSSSTTPNKSPNYPFRTGTVAAA